MTKNTTLTSIDRRRFLQATRTAFAALLASGCLARPSVTELANSVGYGPLRADPNGILDLPEGFSYRILSKLGDDMNDGGTVPNKADGMGCFALEKNELALVRNHELIPTDPSGGPIARGFGTLNGEIVPGGTTHIILDAETLSVKTPVSLFRRHHSQLFRRSHALE